MNITIINFIILFCIYNEDKCIATSSNSLENWNPVIDECNRKLIGYKCRPTVNGKRQPVETNVQTDVDVISNQLNRRQTVDLLSKKNFCERLAIEQKYNKQHSIELLEQFYVNEGNIFSLNFNRKKAFNDFLWNLFNSVGDQLGDNLGAVANIKHNTLFRRSNISTPFIAFLGNISNKGLNYLDQLIKNNSKGRLSLGEQMRKFGNYPEIIISLVDRFMKGDRDEAEQIHAKNYEDDLKKLEENIKINRKNRDQEETFLCDIMTTRSIPHLRKLFIQSPVDFPIFIDNNVKNKFLRRALVDLYSVINNRPRHMAWILHVFTNPIYFTNIIVSRSEIDLENIIHEYYKLTQRSLIDRVKDVFSNEKIYLQGLLNFLESTTEE